MTERDWMAAAERAEMGIQRRDEDILRLTFQRDKAQADARMWEEVANEYLDELEQMREDYRELLLAIQSVQHEALQEYLSSSEDGKRTIDAARTWVRANRYRTAVHDWIRDD